MIANVLNYSYNDRFVNHINRIFTVRLITYSIVGVTTVLCDDMTFDFATHQTTSLYIIVSFSFR